ncbi:MAG: TonB-dependent receptor [Gemmatimonadota bacterium]
MPSCVVTPCSAPFSARQTLVGLMLACLPALAQAQVGQPDSTRKDSAKVVLPEVTVTVTREAEPLSRVPAAVGVVGTSDLRRSRLTIGLDEALNDLPGVFVANRYNFSLDQRLSIRGFGARSNFGIRGVKVLLDGVPQTLPDGQSQLTNVDLGGVGRIEVLRGASSSLYGNASGGVISIQSTQAAAGPFAESVRGEGGAFGLWKASSWSSARQGPLSGTLSVSHTNFDGFRQQSTARSTQVNAGLDYALSAANTATVRFGYGDQPKAENPGALTRTEFFANPDSAAANNILRRADKAVNQEQLALSLHHRTEATTWSATVFGTLRDLKNPLAAPPPQGTGPTVGTYVTIGRQVGGARLEGERRLGSNSLSPRFSAGVDVQRMRDNRTNSLALAGVPDTLFLDQREVVTEVGPYAQLRVTPTARLLATGGVRYDAVKFSVLDHHLSDGVDNSGSRTMHAWSGHVGLSYFADEAFVPYVNVSNSFETPTTTELVNQPNSTGGFNTGLDPQRAVNYEAGVRGRTGALSYSASGFLGRIQDAIVQFREVGGRAFFANAGRLHTDGIELGVNGRATRWLGLQASYTYAHYQFAEYRIVTGAVVDTLDGNYLAGVPKAFVRLGLRVGPVQGFGLAVDHTMSSSVWADDQNTVYVNGWGKAAPGDVNGYGLGVTDLRLTWDGVWGNSRVAPFLAVNNIWDRHYVSSVTPNATFGRFFEPAPGRNLYVGLELGWAAE